MADISRTADKALLLIDVLAETPQMSLQTVAARVQLNRTVVLRLLGTLQMRGFIVRSEGMYALSPMIRRLSDKVFPDLRAAVEPHLIRLAEEAKATAILHILDGSETVVLSQEVPAPEDLALIVRHDIGSRGPLTQGANGKALLAFLDAETIERVLSGAPVDERKSQSDTLAQVRRAGFCMTIDEVQYGAAGLAVPIIPQGHESAIASLGVLMPDIDSSKLMELLPLVQASRERIERKLANNSHSQAVPVLSSS